MISGSTVTLVAAIARNGVIGSAGDIPWRLPGELARFKALTMGHVLVMGRLTYDSIGRPLPGRRTVVVSRQSGWGGDGDDDADAAKAVHVAADVPAGLELAATLGGQVDVVGGAQIYAAALAHADALELTWVNAEPAGDTFFPAVDWTEWKETGREEGDGWSAVRYERTFRADPRN